MPSMILCVLEMREERSEGQLSDHGWWFLVRCTHRYMYLLSDLLSDLRSIRIVYSSLV